MPPNWKVNSVSFSHYLLIDVIKCSPKYHLLLPQLKVAMHNKTADSISLCCCSNHLNSIIMHQRSQFHGMLLYPAIFLFNIDFCCCCSDVCCLYIVVNLLSLDLDPSLWNIFDVHFYIFLYCMFHISIVTHVLLLLLSWACIAWNVWAVVMYYAYIRRWDSLLL